MKSKINHNETSLNNGIKIRNDIKSIIYRAILSLKENIVLIIFAIVSMKKWAYLIVPVILILDIAYIVWKWFNQYFLLSEEEARYHYGIFSKNTIIIPKNNIKSMDISVNLLEKLLRYSKVKIESPVKDADLDEIKIYLSKEKINILKDFAFSKNPYGESLEKIEVLENKENTYKEKEDKFKENTYVKKASNKELFKYGLTTFNIIIIIILIFKGYNILERFIKDSKVNDVISNSTSYLSEHMSLFFGILGILILLIILKCIAVIYYMIKYYDFTVSKDLDTIKVKYGLINSREFSFNINNVKMVRLRSNLLRQIFKIHELSVVVKGYTGIGDENIILYPIGKEKELFNLLQELLPDWIIEGDGDGINKGKLMLVLKPSIIVILISLIGYLIFKTNYVFLVNILLLIVIPSSILKGKNLNLKISKNKIKAVNGGFVRTKYILDKKDIQAVQFKTTPFQERYNLGKILINYYSEIGEVITLNYMRKECVSKILNK
ncbi:PH domain-containing protein [Eubacterium multiforme]|uniref:Membrane protein YdbT with pleckstrin-like domain n=1 Tax=Eubacterium multiforme TaxID=83339 RepID=A0ABT9UW66_9FIRM|nr:PH domain-containing protein [Eubacterium multiforme]MDQ0150539.1 putative membrane protein YdbT with pleckstrin-like domain [Eubacterium multiforme]